MRPDSLVFDIRGAIPCLRAACEKLARGLVNRAPLWYNNQVLYGRSSVRLLFCASTNVYEERRNDNERNHPFD